MAHGPSGISGTDCYSVRYVTTTVIILVLGIVFVIKNMPAAPGWGFLCECRE